MRFDLLPHPLHPPASIRGVAARVLGLDAQWLRLRWRVDGAHALVLPATALDAARADGLWRATCFEAFVRPDAQGDASSAYVEFNLSPSGHWNAYDFRAYRDGMAPRPMARAPESRVRVAAADDGDDADAAQRDATLIFDAAVPRSALPALPCSLGLCAVLEERGGVKSFWALAHPPQGAPDFHAAACFAARLEPTPHTPS